MTDLIRRDDALAKIHWLSDADWTVAERRAAGEIAAAIASLPAVTVGVNESTVRRAVLDWIKNDTGAAVKLTISPDQVNALTARILAALEPAEMKSATTVCRRLGLIGKSRERDRRPTVAEIDRLIAYFASRDPAVLAALPEVRAMIDEALREGMRIATFAPIEQVPGAFAEAAAAIRAKGGEA